MFEKWLDSHKEHGKQLDLLDQLLYPQNLTLTAFIVLHILIHQDCHEMRIQQLSSEIGLSPSATSRLVVKMENQGLLLRESCDLDKRGLYAVLTEQGISVYDKVLPLIEKNI